MNGVIVGLTTGRSKSKIRIKIRNSVKIEYGMI